MPYDICTPKPPTLSLLNKLLITMAIILIFGGVTASFIRPHQNQNPILSSETKLAKSTAITPGFWNFNYDVIETALLTIPIEKGHPELSQNIEPALRRAVLAFPENIDTKTLSRIIWLTQKIIPGGDGEILAQWLIQYHHYHKDVLTLDQSSNGPYRHLEKLIQLQRQHFGEQQAAIIFARQHKLADFASRGLPPHQSIQHNQLTSDHAAP